MFSDEMAIPALKPNMSIEIPTGDEFEGLSTVKSHITGLGGVSANANTPARFNFQMFKS